MRSAIESARTIPEAAASLTTQQQFDQALARLVAADRDPEGGRGMVRQCRADQGREAELEKDGAPPGDPRHRARACW